MFQNVISKNYYSTFYKQTNPLYANQICNKELCLPRSNRKSSSASSEGPKKVSFNPNVEVIDVESWKKYNYDMSKITEYSLFKREFMAYKARQQLIKNRKINDCNCQIF